jgi:hypothetical protein
MAFACKNNQGADGNAKVAVLKLNAAGAAVKMFWRGRAHGNAFPEWEVLLLH